MSLEDYRVSLDAFEGPLDLLLFLIRRDEIDIHDIPISKITSSYMAFLDAEGGMERIDVDLAAEFLVMAATLVEIKSRMLMPAEAQSSPESADSGQGQTNASATPIADPRADLVRQLLAYKRFRDAAAALDLRHEQWQSRFSAAAAAWQAAPVSEDETVDLEDVSIIDLCDAFAQIMEAVDFTRLGEHTVKDDETPIQIHAADIVDRLRTLAAAASKLAESDDGAGDHPPAVSFVELFRGRTRSEAIALFLAMLELIRQRQVVVRQEAIHGTITLRLRDEQDDAQENEAKPEIMITRGRKKIASSALVERGGA